jgi:hypothetical protein
VGKEWSEDFLQTSFVWLDPLEWLRLSGEHSEDTNHPHIQRIRSQVREHAQEVRNLQHRGICCVVALFYVTDRKNQHNSRKGPTRWHGKEISRSPQERLSPTHWSTHYRPPFHWRAATKWSQVRSFFLFFFFVQWNVSHATLQSYIPTIGNEQWWSFRIF